MGQFCPQYSIYLNIPYMQQVKFYHSFLTYQVPPQFWDFLCDPYRHVTCGRIIGHFYLFFSVNLANFTQPQDMGRIWDNFINYIVYSRVFPLIEQVQFCLKFYTYEVAPQFWIFFLWFTHAYYLLTQFWALGTCT